jgi:hypothetical protein
MSEEEVITRFGSPQYVIREKQFLQDGTPIDTYAMYGRPYHPEYMRYWDQFDIGYAHGKVVSAVALRLWDGGAREPAVTLRSTNNDPRRPAPPEIGPAFESVFDCHDAQAAPK